LQILPDPFNLPKSGWAREKNVSGESIGIFCGGADNPQPTNDKK
jgi:hypothetical protein